MNLINQNIESKSDFLGDLPPDIYCDLVETLDKRCAELSLLEIWDFDGDIIKNLTQQEIIDAVNTLDTRFIITIFVFIIVINSFLIAVPGSSPSVTTSRT